MMGFLHNLHGQRRIGAASRRLSTKFSASRASSRSDVSLHSCRRSVATRQTVAREGAVKQLALRRVEGVQAADTVSLATSWACKTARPKPENQTGRGFRARQVLHRRCAVASKTEDSIAAHPAASGSKASFNGKETSKWRKPGIAGNACAS